MSGASAGADGGTSEPTAGNGLGSDASGPRTWLGLTRLGVHRVVGRLRSHQRGRTLLSVAGVAIAVALLVVVTGLSLGLASAGTVDSEGVNYWIVPDDSGTGSVPLAAEGARLGSVHEVSTHLAADDRIEYASPVAIQPIRIERPETGADAYVIAIGVIPPDHDRTVAGIETSGLDPAYTYHNDGAYDGEWSGEAVVTPGTATALDVETGDTLQASGRELTVVDVASTDLAAGVGEAPAVVLPLAELQSLTGLEEGDQADQILVAASDSAVRAELETMYPGTNVVSRSGIVGGQATPTSLPLAMALTAALTAGGIGVAFVATTMGLELTTNRRSIAVLGAIGIPLRGRLLVVVAESVTVSLLGGLVGVALGAVGILLLNARIADTIGIPTVATLSPWLVVYGIVVAVAMGLLAAPYLVYLSARTDVLTELTR